MSGLPHKTSRHALHFMIPTACRNLKVLSHYLKILILIQQEKNPSTICFLMPLSGLNTIKMKSEIMIQQGTIRAFKTTKLPYSHHSLKQMLISDLKKPCNECEGSGYIAGLDEWGTIQINLRQSCHVCSGRGYNLTELGQELWKLYKPMVKKLINEALQKKSE